MPRASFPTYCASKAFLHSWPQSPRYRLRNVPVEVLELAPPYVQTELSGRHQASGPRAMPLDAHVAEVMHLLEMRDHPGSEALVERGRGERSVEREGRYETAFAAINPAEGPRYDRDCIGWRTMDVDFVLHDDTGPASAWARLTRAEAFWRTRPPALLTPTSRCTEDR